MSAFERELQSLLNKHSQENGSNTPDFILARYLTGCLRLFNATANARADWYGRHDAPGSNIQAPSCPHGYAVYSSGMHPNGKPCE